MIHNGQSGRSSEICVDVDASVGETPGVSVDVPVGTSVNEGADVSSAVEAGLESVLVAG